MKYNFIKTSDKETKENLSKKVLNWYLKMGTWQHF